MAIGTKRNAINHQGKESFDGELARLLMYETDLDQQEMVEVYDYLRAAYFEQPKSIDKSTDAKTHQE